MRDGRRKVEVAIVGGGIAGVSLAWFLAERGLGTDVLLLEREPTLGYHASGRSAGVQDELNLDPVLHRLLVSGARFLRRPPETLGGAPFTSPSGVLTLFSAKDLRELERATPWLEAGGTELEIVGEAEARRRMPILTGGAFAGAAWLPACGRLDAARLLGAYTDRARAGGVAIRSGVEVTNVLTGGGRVVGLETSDGREIECRTLVNAAGAWAGPLARMAGATPIELIPRRRTIVTFEPRAIDAAGWPLCDDEASKVYFGPEAGALLASPMDEEPASPGDARAARAAIRETMRRLGALAPALTSGARPLGSRAGLRTFAPDRRPVVGEDPRLTGFFWLAGQGGVGIETSPALARIAADLLTGGETDWPDRSALYPDRFLP